MASMINVGVSDFTEPSLLFFSEYIPPAQLNDGHSQCASAQRLRTDKPEILDSRLVRTGAAIFFLTSALLVVFPALITGLLFFFSAPIALLLILVGTIMSFIRSDKRMNADVAALAVAAKRAGRVWPADSPLRQVDAVVKHGPRG